MAETEVLDSNSNNSGTKIDNDQGQLNQTPADATATATALTNVDTNLESNIITKSTENDAIDAENKTETENADGNGLNTENIEADTEQIDENSQHDNGNNYYSLDNSDNDKRKLFVGGLSWETTENDLKEYFMQFGTVKTCTIKIDNATGHSRGFGFVIFEDEEAINKVLETENHELCNKKIDPKRAKPTYEPVKKIFVGGLDPELSEDIIKEYFGQFGKIEAIDLPFDSQRNKRKAYIFVQYATEAEAKKACIPENQDIHGKMCDVRLAVPKENKPFRSGYGNNWDQWNYGGGYNNYYNQGGNYGYDDYGYQGGYQNYGYDQYGYDAGNNSYVTDYNNSYDNSYYTPPASGNSRGRGFGGGSGGKFRGGRPSRSRGFHPYNR